MAEFALNAAEFDWQPQGGIEIDLAVANALEPHALPVSDLIVMNPPFLAWPMMDNSQREQVSDVLAGSARHRPDLSMAFVTRAMKDLREGGVLATLLPASILSLDSGRAWRKDLLEKARPSFIGFFGDYRLFVHALVQSAALVLVVGDKNNSVLALRSSKEASATSEALRALRRLSGPAISDASGLGWRITTLDRRELMNVDRWRILPANTAVALRRLNELGMTTVEDIFNVKQGLLTGLNDAFVLKQKEISALPTAEAKFFRPALFRNTISYRSIDEKYFVIFPYDDSGLIFSSEDEARQHFNIYFRDYLGPKRSKLEQRSSVGSDQRPWWALSRYYKWAQRADPRLLSKYFGSIGDFAFDANASIVPLQDYAWFLNSMRVKEGAKLVKTDLVLKAYFCLLNSSTFSRLLSVFSDPVQGGQYNLSARFVRSIPLPDLRQRRNGEAAR